MEQKAQRNLKLYPFNRIFTKRVYLPLVSIYFVNVSGLSVEELGFLVGFIGIVNLIVEVPTGYFADKVSRKQSFIIGSLLAMAATLIIAHYQNITGVYIGAILEAIGYAFFSGTGQALVHDSLSVIRREDEYTKYTSRTQSFSLVVNAGIIALVPLTYAIDERLPFLLGTLQFLILLILSLFLYDVRHEPSHDIVKPMRTNWLITHRKFIFFALIFGMLSALYTSPSGFKNLALEAYGINPALLGILFAIASLTGAVMGVYMHKVKNIGLKKYAILDVSVLVLGLLGFGSGNASLAVISFIVLMSFWRYRTIIYQDFILQKYKTKYKATLMSVVYNAEQLNGVWQPAAIGLFVGIYGLQASFVFMSLFAAILSVPFVFLTVRTLSASRA